FGSVVGAVAGLLLAGCYESAEVTVYEPGVYKGAQDPLMQTKGDARAETLEKRFTMVQTDR
ncbi:MAG: hypothetical protein OEQ18_09245, partial [Gammaproteobacteria bacterium]|nr:hypothetical protein [Gammaproteobacteria bacterium]